MCHTDSAHQQSESAVKKHSALSDTNGEMECERLGFFSKLRRLIVVLHFLRLSLCFRGVSAAWMGVGRSYGTDKLSRMRFVIFCLLTFLHHANTQTLLEPAVLTAVAPPLVHWTVLTGQTHILGVFLHGALERE